MPRDDRGPLDRPWLMEEPRLNLHPDDAAEDQAYAGVGAQLKAHREHLELTLDEVARRLRIRLSHLRAIERGRFDDLPGRIYAIGFVRSYAEFLDLDGQSVVEMYKQETAGDEQPTKLVFPTPTPESRMPKVWLVVASVLAAVVLYYGWDRLQAPDRMAVDPVPAVPDRLIAQTSRTTIGGPGGSSSAAARNQPPAAGSALVVVDPVSTAQAASSAEPTAAAVRDVPPAPGRKTIKTPVSLPLSAIPCQIHS